MPIEFFDLNARYGAFKSEIDVRIRRVFEHGQYIMGPEAREL